MSQDQKNDRLTVREWLDIFTDLDAYIERGGQILDLPMSDPFASPAAGMIAERIGSEKLCRIGAFYKAVGELVPKGALVGELISEEQARALWRETAQTA